MPSRRRAVVLACALLLLAGCASAPPRQEDTTAPSADPAKADAVMAIVRDTMAEKHLKAVIVRVAADGKEVLTRAVGDSMTGVPATTNMHFRNGAVAISYVSTLLMILVDERKVSLDDKLSTWLPDVPNADRSANWAK
jgi:CubicO group peptidase (beta-lactamase class C family)